MKSWFLLMQNIFQQPQLHLVNVRYLYVCYLKHNIQPASHSDFNSDRMIEDLNTHCKPAIIGPRSMSKTVSQAYSE